MRPFWLLLAAILLVAGPASSAPERRIALVVGMGQYANVPALPNPTKDARAMARSFAKLGFEVEERIDVDHREFSRALREFGVRAQSANVAVIYYAGHGMQVDRDNYLIPVDARLERERDLVYEAMPLDLLLDEASQARTLGIVILDACRNNPFAERLAQLAQTPTRAMDVRQGLARVDDTPKDTLVALATRSDALAEDGEGEHSPYTQALLHNLEVPGLELGLFFRRVRDEVLKATNGRQEPFTFGSLGAEPFFFNPLPPNAQPTVPALPPVELSDEPTPKRLGIAGLADPDGDSLVVRLTGLPKGGELRLGQRVLLIGDALTAEQLGQVTFTPDGRFTGQAGPLAFAVEDGKGATVSGSLFIKIVASNRPPSVEPELQFQTVAHPLGLREPVDPDGDKLTVTVSAVPRLGVVRMADGRAVKVGQRLEPGDLEKLAYDPGGGGQGEAGQFAYVVEDPRGAKAEARVRIAIGARPSGGGGAPNIAAVQEPPKAAAEPGMQVASTQPPATAQDPPPPPRTTVATPHSPRVQKPSPQPSAPAPAVGVFPKGAVEEDVQGGIRDCPLCPVLVKIEPGSFTMGSATGDPSSRPPHKVTLAKPFAIGKYEVTVGEWKACVQAGGCRDATEPGGGDDRLPVRNIDWNDAVGYVEWLSEQTGKRYRLPSEAEWEYAARGGTRTAYWWGDTLGKGRANCQDCGGEYDRNLPAVVDAFPANPFGLHGTSGGVAEWVADCWTPSHAGSPKDGSVREKSGCTTRVLRGGSWRNDHSYAGSASRFYYDADVRYLANGLRVAREME